MSRRSSRRSSDSLAVDLSGPSFDDIKGRKDLSCLDVNLRYVDWRTNKVRKLFCLACDSFRQKFGDHSLDGDPAIWREKSSLRKKFTSPTLLCERPFDKKHYLGGVNTRKLKIQIHEECLHILKSRPSGYKFPSPVVADATVTVASEEGGTPTVSDPNLAQVAEHTTASASSPRASMQVPAEAHLPTSATSPPSPDASANPVPTPKLCPGRKLKVEDKVIVQLSLMEAFDGSALKIGDTIPLASNFCHINGAADLIMCLEAVTDGSSGKGELAYFLRSSQCKRAVAPKNFRLCPACSEAAKVVGRVKRHITVTNERTVKPSAVLTVTSLSVMDPKSIQQAIEVQRGASNRKMFNANRREKRLREQREIDRKVVKTHATNSIIPVAEEK